MPIYEYNCNACGARTSVFVRTMNGEVNAVCRRCGGVDLRRAVSRFAIGRPAPDITSLNKNRMLDGVDYSNPASMANFFRNVQSEFRDEPNEHMDEIVKRLDHGESVPGALGLDSHDHSAPSGGDDASA